MARRVVVNDARTSRPGSAWLTTPSNILLLGVDLREGHPEEGGRADTLLLLHLDPGGWASLLTIPRDSLAEIPGYGEAKINRGFTWGFEQSGGDVPQAMATAADTVEQFLALPGRGERVDYVATVNFDGFAALVDALGGIEVDVPRRIVDDEYPTADFGTMTLVIEAGRQRMNGEKALQYVRTRHADSDFGRGQRQQQVVQAMSAALQQTPLPLRPFAALRVLNAASGAIQTTMPVGRLDALLLAWQLSSFDPSTIAQYRIAPDTVAVQEEGSDLRWNETGIEQVVGQLFTPPGEAQEAARVQVLNGTGVGGLATRVSATLTDANFALIQPDDGLSTATSSITIYGNLPFTLRRLRPLVGNLPVVQRPAEEAPGVEIVVLLGDDYAKYVGEQ